MARVIPFILFLLLIACQNNNQQVDIETNSPETTVYRTNNLGISGPNLEHLKPGPDFLKINSAVDSSVFKENLIPPISPILNIQIRDVAITLGGDGFFYLTGSTGDDIWDFNDGIELWKSPDLKNWEYLGLVWSFENDATWQKEWRFHAGRKCRSIWGPELSYINNDYYLTYSMPPGDRGILKSTSGKPEGPYVNAIANDGRLPEGLDASLFQDDDGSIYMVYGGGEIVKLNEDLSGEVDEPFKPVLLNPDLNPDHHALTCEPRRNCEDIGREGAFLFKNNGKYYLSIADTYEGRYSSMVAISDKIEGPYEFRHEAVPCAGGGTYFKDTNGNWYCCFFGNDNQMPWREMPAILPIKFGNDHLIVLK